MDGEEAISSVHIKQARRQPAVVQTRSSSSSHCPSSGFSPGDRAAHCLNSYLQGFIFEDQGVSRRLLFFVIFSQLFFSSVKSLYFSNFLFFYFILFLRIALLLNPLILCRCYNDFPTLPGVGFLFLPTYEFTSFTPRACKSYTFSTAR